MADNSAGNWCLIESDPGVFTELIKEFGNMNIAINKHFSVKFEVRISLFAGCDGVQVEELWSMEAENFKNLE